MANRDWDKLIDDVEGRARAAEFSSTERNVGNLHRVRTALREAIAEVVNANAELERKLAQANEFVDRLGEFLLCVNQPHDYDCANYRDETKPCDCGYEELTKRFNEHRARVEREGNQCQKN